MSAIVDARTNVMRRLDKRAEPEVVVTPDDVQDPEKLARMVQDLRRELTALKRRRYGRVFFAKNLDTNTTSKIRIEHKFGSEVVWSIVKADSIDVELVDDSATDDNTLVLTSTGTAKVTLRIEEVG